jgi:replicative DNA helicase
MKSFNEYFYPNNKKEQELFLPEAGLPPVNHRMTTMPKFSLASDGVSTGMYVIAAESNVGKTATLIQIAIDVLNSNEDSNVLFFSLDDMAKKIQRRFASCQHYFETGNIHKTSCIKLALSEYDTGNETDGYFKIPEMSDSKRKVWKKLFTYRKTGRLRIYDGVFSPEEVQSKVEELKNEKTIVIIDGVYNLSVGGSGLEADEDRANSVKLISTKNDVPLICVKEVRKGATRGEGTDADGNRITKPCGIDDIMGSAKWGFNSDFVITLWNKSNFIVGATILKNKIGDFKPQVAYNFYPSKNVYIEVKEI